MRKLVSAAIVLSISLLLAAAAGRTAVVPFVDPIQGVAHGAGFGLDGKEIVVTADFIAKTQNLYTRHVLDSASTAQIALYQSKRSYLDALASGATLPRDLQAALYANSVLLDWLIDEVVPSDAAQLKVRNSVLIAWMRRGLGYLGAGQEFVLFPSETALFVLAGIVAPGAAAATAAPPADKVLQARETYAKQCRKAGVPIPPTWGGGLWTLNGTLADPFIESSLKADVYFFESATPKGVCLALPRHEADPAAPNKLLGIICMGEKNACFWDNQKDGMQTDIPRMGEFPLNTYFAAGQELDGGTGGTCTECHAGKNAYVVHPDDPAFQNIPNKNLPKWYKPIVAASWPQNPGPDTDIELIMLRPGQESCTDCHALPKIEKGMAGYCDAVLAKALVKTMPPGGGVPLPDPAYMQHTDYLAQVCAAAKK